MKLVKVRKERTTIKVKMSRKEKNVIKNIISLIMMAGGIASLLYSVLALFMIDPNYSLLAVPTMMRFGLLGVVLLFTSPFLKYCVKF